MTSNRRCTRSILLGATALAGALFLSATQASAQERRYDFDVPAQPLNAALQTFARQAQLQVIFAEVETKDLRAPPLSGAYSAEEALQVLLAGTDLKVMRTNKGVFQITATPDPQSGGAAGDGADGTVEALIVTAQKREEDIQDVPIAISAFTQEALERSQVAGGPDLMTQVPNMTFTKTNFTGYSIQIRGIGTQAISATTDAAVAVAFNNTPFIRNRFFEQEFYDLQRVEVLRGPQGTLYGRNATAGVVNLISQKPKFAHEAKLSADVANYNSTRLEGMLNVPLADDRVALRLAGAWTKREGYATNQLTGNPIDGRDLWSTRASLRMAPTDAIDINLIWEHFEEDDDRIRSGKQLCHQDDREALGHLMIKAPGVNGEVASSAMYSNVYSQGCLAASLYSPDSYEAPNGYSLPYYLPFSGLNVPIAYNNGGVTFNPYASLVQSPDLRIIESTIDPDYRAKSDVVELQFNFGIGADLTLTSETSYLYDTIFSLQDYNRFNTVRGAFAQTDPGDGTRDDYITPGEFGGIFCDPQIGCSDRLVAIDVSRAKSSHFSQEFRLGSDYDGPFNFSLGANFLRYDTEDKYYVFINTLSMYGAKGANIQGGSLPPWEPGVSDNHECFTHGMVAPNPAVYQTLIGCQYIDPNPIESVNDLGHNYFLSRNPYKLISYAVFGEAYYNIAENLKLTAGLRWTVDKKEAPRIPSMLLAGGNAGLSVLEVEEQEWREPTGRLTVDWKPALSFTDETLLYASYAHGYKAGGSNPPPSTPVVWQEVESGLNVGDIMTQASVLKPKTFDPEFVDAFEVGAKNTLLDGRLTLNVAAFYYDYEAYQISQIIDRSAVNYNFDSKVWGLEIEADWRPLENLRLGFKGGYENTRIADGEHAIDIMDRTAGRSDWVVVRPFPTFPSNCVLPLYVFDQGVGADETFVRYPLYANGFMGPCEYAYSFGRDPGTMLPYVANPTLTWDTTFLTLVPMESVSWGYVDYPGFNPRDASLGHNNGEGFYKEIGGNELPNAPHFTATITADYTVPLPNEWLMTLHTDLYYQSEAWTRVFNTEGYDKLKAFTNVNLAAIFTNEDAGWKVMAYVKNVFDRDSITGAFLNSDDSGLTTNVFLTEPRLHGLRVTKDFQGGPWWTGANPDHAGPYPLTIELSGQVQRHEAPYAPVAPDFVDDFSEAIDPTAPQQRDLDWGDGREVSITYRPGAGDWSIAAGMRYGRSNKNTNLVHADEAAGPARCAFPFGTPQAEYLCSPDNPDVDMALVTGANWSDSAAWDREKHVMADFIVGKDFGLGLMGNSTLSAGLRYAQFESTTRATMRGGPDLYLPDAWALYNLTRNEHRADITSTREFTGVGPTLTWDAAQRLFGSDDEGHLDLDWAIAGGVLFGRQETQSTGMEGSLYTTGKYVNLLNGNCAICREPVPLSPIEVGPRSRDVTVPMLDLSLGLSYEISRVKIGAGYRWERYYDVLDAGYDEHEDADRTMDGPYLKLAVGFGG